MKHSTVEEDGLKERKDHVSCSIYLCIYFMDTYRVVPTHNIKGRGMMAWYIVPRCCSHQSRRDEAVMNKL